MNWVLFVAVRETDVIGLPDGFSDLISLLDEWSTADLALRTEKLSSANPADLSAMVERLLPLLPAIDAYLESFGKAPLDEPARRLLHLTECTLDAQHELSARGPAPDNES
jgi:hypothetical protein